MMMVSHSQNVLSTRRFLCPNCKQLFKETDASPVEFGELYLVCPECETPSAISKLPVVGAPGSHLKKNGTKPIDSREQAELERVVDALEAEVTGIEIPQDAGPRPSLESEVVEDLETSTDEPALETSASESASEIVSAPSQAEVDAVMEEAMSSQSPAQQKSMSELWPRPERKLAPTDVVRLHSDYLDQVDGRHATLNELLRFRVEAQREDGKTYFVCAVCNEEEEVFHCRQFGSVVTCKKCSFKVMTVLMSMDPMPRARFTDKNGVIHEGDPRPNYLIIALRDAGRWQKNNHKSHHGAAKGNLLRETELLSAKAEEPESDFIPAERVGNELIDVSSSTHGNSGQIQQARGETSHRRERRKSVKQVGGVEIHLADSEPPTISEDVLASATTEYEFVAILGPLYDFNNSRKSALGQNEELVKSDNLIRAVSEEIRRVRQIWEFRNPSGLKRWSDRGMLLHIMKKQYRKMGLAKSESDALEELVKDAELKREADTAFAGWVAKYGNRRNESDERERERRVGILKSEAKARELTDDERKEVQEWDDEQKKRHEAQSQRATQEKDRRARQLATSTAGPSSGGGKKK